MDAAFERLAELQIFRRNDHQQGKSDNTIRAYDR